jgi:hypothetical protein
LQSENYNETKQERKTNKFISGRIVWLQSPGEYSCDKRDRARGNKQTARSFVSKNTQLRLDKNTTT